MVLATTNILSLRNESRLPRGFTEAAKARGKRTASANTLCSAGKRYLDVDPWKLLACDDSAPSDGPNLLRASKGSPDDVLQQLFGHDILIEQLGWNSPVVSHSFRCPVPKSGTTSLPSATRR